MMLRGKLGTCSTAYCLRANRTLSLQPRHNALNKQQLTACLAQSHQGSWSVVDAEEAKRLVEREGYKILDVRSSRDYDYGHITKPARSSLNAPVVLDDNNTWNQNFISEVACQAAKAAKLIVMCSDGGALSDAALQQLNDAAYTAVVKLEGGYQGWSQVWSPSGKRRPPPGRWVSTGKEALKSGLTIPGVADSYDEGGNLSRARFAEGLRNGETLLEPMWKPDQQQQQQQLEW